MQQETSHSRIPNAKTIVEIMDINEVFRINLLAAIKARGLKEAELSKLANLNARAVTDIREGRTRSPKLSTAIALAEALGIDPAEMMGLGKRYNLRDDLAKMLSEYSEEDQERLVAGLSVLGSPQKPKQ